MFICRRNSIALRAPTVMLMLMHVCTSVEGTNFTFIADRAHSSTMSELSSCDQSTICNSLYPTSSKVQISSFNTTSCTNVSALCDLTSFSHRITTFAMKSSTDVNIETKINFSNNLTIVGITENGRNAKFSLKSYRDSKYIAVSTSHTNSLYPQTSYYFNANEYVTHHSSYSSCAGTNSKNENYYSNNTESLITHSSSNSTSSYNYQNAAAETTVLNLHYNCSGTVTNSFSYYSANSKTASIHENCNSTFTYNYRNSDYRTLTVNTNNITNGAVTKNEFYHCGNIVTYNIYIDSNTTSLTNYFYNCNNTVTYNYYSNSIISTVQNNYYYCHNVTLINVYSNGTNPAVSNTFYDCSNVVVLNITNTSMNLPKFAAPEFQFVTIDTSGAKSDPTTIMASKSTTYQPTVTANDTTTRLPETKDESSIRILIIVISIVTLVLLAGLVIGTYFLASFLRSNMQKRQDANPGAAQDYVQPNATRMSGLPVAGEEEVDEYDYADIHGNDSIDSAVNTAFDSAEQTQSTMQDSVGGRVCNLQEALYVQMR